MLTLTSYLPGIAFAAVATAVYVLFTHFDPYWVDVRSRVTQLKSTITAGPPGPSKEGHQAAKWDFFSLMPMLGVLGQRDNTKLSQRLAKAGIYQPSALSRFLAVSLILPLGAVALCLSLLGMGLLRKDAAMLLACFTGLAGVLAPRLWLERSIKRRRLQFRRSLPDFLDLMTVCLEGGLSLQETIRRVSDELSLAHPALSSELTVVQRDIELGATVDNALKRFANRSDYDGVRSLSTFIREAQKFGTNVTDALRSHADMLRSQREQAAEENAQKAAVKILLPTMLLIFPAIFVVAVGPAVIQIQDAFTAK
jgi:tight adherence protein C